MKLTTLKWAQAILLSLLILLPKQIFAYQKTVVLPPTRNYTIHGRIVDSFTNLPIAKVKLTFIGRQYSNRYMSHLYMERQSGSSRLLFLYAREFE